MTNDYTSEIRDSITINGVYIVVQDAIYRHKIWGAFTDLDRAIKQMTRYLHEHNWEEDNWFIDADGHHSYEFYFCPFSVSVGEEENISYVGQLHPDVERDPDANRSAYIYKWTPAEYKRTPAA